MSVFWNFYYDVLDDDDIDSPIILEGNCQCEAPGWTFYSPEGEVNVHVPCTECSRLVSKERKKYFLVKKKVELKHLNRWERRFYLKK